ncbi:hypothetical protein F4780DRAFT_749555 [Xylariomycetidae sp. FL0641]|nr:hypothetical protein F4780DRAFT_749555 [Xylariomycetidae sp. FL0641]
MRISGSPPAATGASIDPLATVQRNTRIERILYSVDYPFASNEDGLRFMQELEGSGLVTGEQVQRIAFRNAEDLLKVRVTYKDF